MQEIICGYSRKIIWQFPVISYLSRQQKAPKKGCHVTQPLCVFLMYQTAHLTPTTAPKKGSVSHQQRLLTPGAARSGDQFWRVHQEQLPVIRSRNTAGPANKVTQCHSNKVTQRVLLTTFLCSVHLLTTFACISSPPPFWRKLELVALGVQ